MRFSSRIFQICSLLVSCLSCICDAKKLVKYIPRQNVTVSYLLYASAGIVMIVVFLGCMFLCRQICPNGPVFTALELDEIQLERLNEMEEDLERNMRQLQQKLDTQKKKKEAFLQDRVLNLLIPNSKNNKSGGDNDYLFDNTPLKQNAQHNNKPSPILNSLTKDSRKSPAPDYSQNSRFAQGKTNKKFDFAEMDQKSSGRKEEDEKEDLWKLWNKVYDKDNKSALTKKGSSQEMLKDDSNHSKSDYAYKSIKYGDKSKSFSNVKAAPSPTATPSNNTLDTTPMKDTYGKKKSGMGGTPARREESGDYNHGLNKATTNVMMNLKPLSSNVQSSDAAVTGNTPPRPTPTREAVKPVSQQNMSQYSIKVPVQNYDPMKATNGTRETERLDPSVPRPRPPPPKYPPPSIASSNNSMKSDEFIAAGESTKENGASMPTASVVGTGTLRERAPQRRPPPPKGPPPKRSIMYDNGGDDSNVSEKSSLLNNKND